jgi:hypothetical protein
LSYGKYVYPSDHFAQAIETAASPHFIIALRRWSVHDPIDVIAILLPDDCRGFRSVVKLVDRQCPSRAFNRAWTRAEESAVSELSFLLSTAYQRIGLFPQIRRDGSGAVRYDQKTGGHEYGTRSDPYRLFAHIIGRQQFQQPSTSPVSGVPYVDPGRRFTLAGEFYPWRHSSDQRAVAEALRQLVVPQMHEYGFVEFEEAYRDETALKQLPTLTWTKSTHQKTGAPLFRRLERSDVRGLQTVAFTHYPWILSDEKRPKSQMISRQAFASWHEREKKAGRVVLEDREFVVWHDVKQTPWNLYWVVWFTDPVLVWVHDLRPSHLSLLRRIKETILSLLRQHARDTLFDLVLHDPADMRRLHIQVVPTLASVHHSGTEHLNTLSAFSVTLDRVVASLNAPLPSHL